MLYFIIENMYKLIHTHTFTKRSPETVAVLFFEKKRNR